MKTENEIKKNRKEDAFILIEASKLSLKDDFLRYEVTTEEEENLKLSIFNIINEGFRDFYCQKFDPSITDDGQIFYAKGNKPAVGQTYLWWVKKAKELWPERCSRLGNEDNYTAFLGILLKNMISSGKWSKSEAWRAVCNDSTTLGHFKNSSNAKSSFEPTGSRKILNFYDLANTSKILTSKYDKHSMILGSGSYKDDGAYYPLAYSSYLYTNNTEDTLYDCMGVEDAYFNASVGWVILDK